MPSMLMQPVSARCMRSCVPCCGLGWAPTARRLHQVFWAAAPVPLMSSACMTSVTSTLSGKCHIFLSALLCKLCGTSIAALFASGDCTVRQFKLAQVDITGFAHVVMDCFGTLI